MFRTRNAPQTRSGQVPRDDAEVVERSRLERIQRSLDADVGVLPEQLVWVLDAHRPAEPDRAAARRTVQAATGTVAVHRLSPLVVQVAIDAPGPERVETVAICHLERSPTDPAVAEIEGVLTVPAWRGRGLGGAVVIEAAARARADGIDVVWLRTRAGGPAAPLYRRLGFTPVGSIGPG